MNSPRARVVSLFDCIDMEGADYSPVRDMTVRAARRSDVDEFCGRWHYSNTGGNATWCYGLWQEQTLVGVVAYNLPTMEACAAVFGPERWEWVAHMGRLVCSDNAPKNSESRLIAGSLALFKRDRPIVRAVLTYAAQGEGHIGVVYQATNALYCGVTARTHHYVDGEGRRRAAKQGVRLSMSKAEARGWVVHREAPKHRYLYLIGSKTERREARRLLRYEPTDYPKRVSSLPGVDE